MRWAIALALEAAGRTSPNPMVGAVVVKGGRMLGEGYHRRAGTPHAEVHALQAAGRKARGADLYVTLEPCCHDGRTPPCVPMIVAAGIRRVIVGMRDPNPLVDGCGIRALRAAGLEVIEGVLEQNCRAINEAYAKFIVHGIPQVIVKVALSLDGKIATSQGESRWITNESCRRYVHGLRSQVDAVMVGGGTIRADDPRLTVRLPGWHGIEPKAIIVDEGLRFPRTARVVRRPRGQLIAVATSRASKAMRCFLERRGHEVVICRSTSEGHVFLPHLLQELGRRGITSILVEGGGRLFSDVVGRNLADRFIACIAPTLIGGAGMDFLPGVTIARMRNAVKLQHVRIQQFGDNVVIEGSVR